MTAGTVTRRAGVLNQAPLFCITPLSLHLGRPSRLPVCSSPDDTSIRPAEVGLACTFLRWVLTLTDSPIDKERTGPDQDERSLFTEYAPGSLFLADKSFSWLTYPGRSGNRGIAIGSHDQGLRLRAGLQDRGRPTRPFRSCPVLPYGLATGTLMDMR